MLHPSAVHNAFFAMMVNRFSGVHGAYESTPGWGNRQLLGCLLHGLCRSRILPRVLKVCSFTSECCCVTMGMVGDVKLSPSDAGFDLPAGLKHIGGRFLPATWTPDSNFL